MGPLRALRHLKAAVYQKCTAGWCHNWDQMPGLWTFSLALVIHNIQIVSGNAVPRTYIEHKLSKNLQRTELCIYEKEIHVQGKKNGTIFCEIASCINGGNSLSLTCPELIIKIHRRVIAYYCQFYYCLLFQRMNEVRINVIDFFKAAYNIGNTNKLRHFTSLSKCNAKVRKDKCLLEGKKNALLQLRSLLLSDGASHLIFV